MSTGNIPPSQPGAPSSPPSPPPDPWLEWLSKAKQEVENDIAATSDDFDKNLLTISTGALGLSIAFLKDVAPVGQAKWTWALYVSWIALSLVIASTMASFRFSMHAAEARRDWYFKVFEEKNESAVIERPWSESALVYCKEISTYAFGVGLLLTLLFVVINAEALNHGAGKQESQSAARTTNIFYEESSAASSGNNANAKDKAGQSGNCDCTTQKKKQEHQSKKVGNHHVRKPQEK